MNLYGVVKAFGDILPLGDRKIGISKFGGVLVDPAVGLPLAAASKANRVFGATSATATAVAPVTAVPTTAAAWFLWNNEPDGGRDYYIDRIACWHVSGTAGLGASLLACVTLGRQAIGPTTATNSILQSLSGGPLDTKAIFDTDTTITGGTPPWINVASFGASAVISVGMGLVANMKGAFRVKPGHGLGITVLAPAGATSLFGVSVVWVEI